jgi:hypothetical protein
MKVEHEFNCSRVCNRSHVQPFLLRKFELQFKFPQQGLWKFFFKKKSLSSSFATPSCTAKFKFGKFQKKDPKKIKNMDMKNLCSLDVGRQLSMPKVSAHSREVPKFLIAIKAKRGHTTKLMFSLFCYENLSCILDFCIKACENLL